jgi:twitching motility protein PilI
MAARTSLQDYQRELAERLQTAATRRSTSKLGLRVGDDAWLVDLADAGEVLPVPAITPVPLTRPWFKGVTNIRGKLYNVVDFPAFLGGDSVSIGEQARLLLVGERYRTSCALLINSALGLRNPADLQRIATNGAKPSWIKAQYKDKDGKTWQELDLPLLVQDPNFLGVGS